MLTPLQQRIASILGRVAAGGVALSGGAALIGRGLVPRTTRDLDYFATNAHDVHSFADDAERVLRGDGLGVTREREEPSFVRLLVSDGHDTCEVDVAEDARILPVAEGPFGPTLAEDELAADKVLALDDRARGRDFVDVWYLAARHGKARLLELARMKNPTFDPRGFGEVLGAIDRLARSEFEVDDATLEQMRAFYREWQAALALPGPGRR